MREELTNLRRFYGDHVPTLLEARHEYAVLCPLVERPDGLHLLFEAPIFGFGAKGTLSAISGAFFCGRCRGWYPLPVSQPCVPPPLR